MNADRHGGARLRGGAGETGPGGFLAVATAGIGGLPSLEELNFLFLNNFFILATVFILFISIFFYYRLRKMTAPPKMVLLTLKLSVFGFLLLFLDFQLKDVPHYGPLVTAVQGLIVLFCLSNLLIYFIVDIYLYHRAGKETPTFVRELVSLAIYLFFAIVSLRLIFHIEISSIVTTTTVLTAAIAFAMQSTLGNVLAGFSIQTDRLLSLDTWVSIHEKNILGKILNIGFRYTTLRTLDNNLVQVPNSTFVQNIITSFGSSTDPNKVAVNLTVSLGYELPPERAKSILMRVLTDDKAILADPPPLVRLRSLADSSIDYQLKFYLEEYSNRDSTTDRVYTRAWYAITREGFSFPFPHQEIIVTKSIDPFRFPVETVMPEIRKIELFTVLEDREVESLAERARIKVYGPGESVVRQGEEGNSLFIVLKGGLHALINEIRVGELPEGSVFGEMSLLTGEPRKASVVASSEVVVAELSRESIEPVIRRRPEIMESLSAILAHRELMNEASLREAERDVAEVTKCAEYLTRLRRFFGLQ
jgi:small-conductance mechanosensitive channel/CRP-like cAMP-binding protein